MSPLIIGLIILALGICFCGCAAFAAGGYFTFFYDDEDNDSNVDQPSNTNKPSTSNKPCDKNSLGITHYAENNECVEFSECEPTDIQIPGTKTTDTVCMPYEEPCDLGFELLINPNDKSYKCVE